MKFPFEIPRLPGETTTPSWQNGVFTVGNSSLKVLKYSQNNAGWNDGLTIFHEETTSSHPVDVASRNYAISQIKRFCKTECPVVLEVGCSSGYLLKDLQNNFSDAFIIGADITAEKLEVLADAMPNIPFMQFDLTQCPLPDESVDVLVMLNVLEHIEQDKLALTQVKRILKKGGLLVLEVPAGPHLYDVYDKFLHHFRRYKSSDLVKMLVEVGFDIKRQSHLGVFLYPFFCWVKKKNQKFLNLSASEQEEIVAQEIKKTEASFLFRLIMQIELFLGRYVSYRCGIRCLITVKK